MSKATKGKIREFANGKRWIVIAIRPDDYVVKIGDLVWCFRKCNADK